jgi:hypothetical protein
MNLCRNSDYLSAHKGDVWIDSNNDVFMKVSDNNDGGNPRWSGNWARFITHFTPVEKVPQNIQLEGTLTTTQNEVTQLRESSHALLNLVTRMAFELDELKEKVYGKVIVKPGTRKIDLEPEQQEQTV